MKWHFPFAQFSMRWAAMIQIYRLNGNKIVESRYEIVSSLMLVDIDAAGVVVVANIDGGLSISRQMEHVYLMHSANE